MLRRLSGLVVYATAGLIFGYLLWGTRVGVLTETLNRTILEQDGLRSVMHQQARLIDSLGSAPQVDHQEVTVLRVRLDETRDMLQQSRASAASAVAAADRRDLALSECTEVQSNLQKQLEGCIFVKADLQRQASRVPEPRERPRSGTSTVHESIEYPAGVEPPSN